MRDPMPPELFPQRPVQSSYGKQPRSGKSRVWVVVASLVVVIGACLGLYVEFSGNSAPTEIPTIKAETPLKQRPDQPGGIDIPHQDVQVYQELDNKTDNQPQTEHLLPPPETPQTTMAAPQPEPVSPMVPPVPTPAPVVAQAPPTPVILQPVKPPVAQIPTTVTPVTVAPVAPIAPPKTITSAEPKKLFTGQMPQDIVSGQANKTSMVQLASFPDQQVAQTQMQKLQTKYASALGATHLHVTKADLGSKGIYYRIQSEMMSSAQASSVCAALWQQKAACILIMHP